MATRLEHFPVMPSVTTGQIPKHGPFAYQRVIPRWEKPEQRPQPIALTPKNIASARAAEQEYNVGTLPLLGRQSFVESLRRRYQTFPRIERLHHGAVCACIRSMTEPVRSASIMARCAASRLRTLARDTSS